MARVITNIRVHPWWYAMVLPGVAFFIVFRYLPLGGIALAFKNYRVLEGIWGSPWVGFKHFETLFNSYYFANILLNTVLISFLKSAFGILTSLILALLLNEVRVTWFKRLIQTVTYLPHFLSWVVISGILLSLLSPAGGLINAFVVNQLHLQPVAFLTSPEWFRFVLVASELWKNMGWNAVIFLAALTGISPTLYEAAAVDGASRLQRVWNITLPGILPVIGLVALLNIGNIMNAGFEQVFVLYNPAVYDVSDIIDTWVYRQGLQNFQLELATAVGLFKGVIGFILILTTNWIAKKTTGSGIIW
jgi:putative aldouronate transport system permease protein